MKKRVEVPDHNVVPEHTWTDEQLEEAYRVLTNKTHEYASGLDSYNLGRVDSERHRRHDQKNKK